MINLCVKRYCFEQLVSRNQRIVFREPFFGNKGFALGKARLRLIRLLSSLLGEISYR